MWLNHPSVPPSSSDERFTIENTISVFRTIDILLLFSSHFSPCGMVLSIIGISARSEQPNCTMLHFRPDQSSAINAQIPNHLIISWCALCNKLGSHRTK